MQHIVRTYTNSAPAVDEYNNCSCSLNYYATYWFRNANGDYDIQCEGFFRMQSELENNSHNGNSSAEIIPGFATVVAPNPSAGIFT